MLDQVRHVIPISKTMVEREEFQPASEGDLLRALAKQPRGSGGPPRKPSASLRTWGWHGRSPE